MKEELKMTILKAKEVQLFKSSRNFNQLKLWFFGSCNIIPLAPPVSLSKILYAHIIKAHNAYINAPCQRCYLSRLRDCHRVTKKLRSTCTTMLIIFKV